MEQFKLKANEPRTITFDRSKKLTIMASSALIVLKNGSPLSPLPGGGDLAVYQGRFRVGDELDLIPTGSPVEVSVHDQPLASPYDPVDPESIVETLAPEEMSLYDRLRGEMLAMMSQLADKNGLETIDEADDLDLDDEEDPLIDTPYEYEAMIEEIPVETPPLDAPEGDSKQPDNGEQTPAPADASGAAAPAGEESAPADEK